MAKVFLKKISNYEYNNVYNSLKDGLNTIGSLTSFIKYGDKVLIKPNMITGMPAEKAVNTHPSLVKAVAELVLECGGKPVIGDSPQFGTATAAAKKIRYDLFAKDMNIPIVDFVSPVSVQFDKGIIFKKFDVDKTIIESDKIINIAKLKTHTQMLLTLTVKNMFGAVVGAEKLKKHAVAGRDRLYFAKLILELYSFCNPCLNLLDGIESMQGFGPISGEKINTGFILGGSDGVAVDRITCKILNIPVEDVPVLYANKILKCGEDNIENIQVVSDNINTIQIDNFIIPKLEQINTFGPVPEFMMNFLRNKISSRPVVNMDKCILCKNCLNACPVHALYLTKSNRIINDSAKCIRCYCCMEACQSNAIAVHKPFLSKLFFK